VTGATGFIGSHLVRRLRLLDAEVHAISRTPPEKAEQGEIWHACDLADAEATAELVRSVRPDVVFHLASAVTGARDVRLVLPIMQANLGSAANVLTAVADNPDTRVVLAGSLEEPRDGDPSPSSPYAVAKWAATAYARMFHRLWNVPSTVLRVGMVYGPGQRDTTKLVPYVTLSLLRGHEPSVSSGNRLVDWVYVDDVVDAFLAAAAAENAVGHAFDIGTGAGTSIRDTVDLLGRVVGTPVQPRYGAVSDRPLDSARIANIAPAADVLQWRPITDLEEGLRRTVAWYADRM
jgi:nucleoside-diphosphate-sugar epimerase